MTSQAVRSAPPLPGGVGISRLRVYDWEGPDGLRGGSPHVHLVCSEAYLVLDGAGAVQTLGPAGFNETPVQRGSLLWFTPGLIHRLINHGDLEIIVLMQIATLPEAGDCILTFPEDVLRDRESLPRRRRARSRPLRRGRRRRRGEAAARPGGRGLQPAARGQAVWTASTSWPRPSSAPLAPAWRDAWETGPAAAVSRAGELVASLEDGGVPPLAAAMFGIDPPASEVLGLCGRLHVYPSVDGVPVI